MAAKAKKVKQPGELLVLVGEEVDKRRLKQKYKDRRFIEVPVGYLLVADHPKRGKPGMLIIPMDDFNRVVRRLLKKR